MDRDVHTCLFIYVREYALSLVLRIVLSVSSRISHQCYCKTLRRHIHCFLAVFVIFILIDCSRNWLVLSTPEDSPWRWRLIREPSSNGFLFLGVWVSRSFRSPFFFSSFISLFYSDVWKRGLEREGGCVCGFVFSFIMVHFNPFIVLFFFFKRCYWM